MKQIRLFLTLAFVLALVASVTIDTAPAFAWQSQVVLAQDQEESEDSGRRDRDPLPLEEDRNFTLNTDEGSWISLDVSPDGDWIVFDLLGDLYLLPFNGGMAQQITSGMEFDSQPRFSPDGQWLAFLASGDGPLASAAPAAVLPAAWITNGVQDVWLIRPDGTGLTRLTTVLEDTPYFSWSADGRQILLRGAFGTYLVEVETRVTQTLGPGEFHGAHDWAGVLPEDAP